MEHRMGFDLKRRSILKVGAATLLSGSAGVLLIEKDEPIKIQNKPRNLQKETIELIQIEHETAVIDNLEKVKTLIRLFLKTYL